MTFPGLRDHSRDILDQAQWALQPVLDEMVDFNH